MKFALGLVTINNVAFIFTLMAFTALLPMTLLRKPREHRREKLIMLGDYVTDTLPTERSNNYE